MDKILYRERAEKLADWVRLKHEGQLIKLSGKPYFNHLEAVASMAAPLTQFGYEAGICHDLLEKTQTSVKELGEALVSFGYLSGEAEYIAGRVVELTNVFTKAAYPDLKKSSRKEKEAVRLPTISAGAQTVKYADLIYNIEWMMAYDHHRAKKYLKRKKRLLAKMDKGDKNLYQKALDLIEKSISTFTKD
jgi:(p)ppGpp synthase/HD superfamily hydrolase